MVTPIGQQFLHILKEDLVSAFCRTPQFLTAFKGAIASLSNAGREFVMKKYEIKALDPKKYMVELSKSFPSHAAVLGVNTSLPQDYPWWELPMEKATLILANTLFSDYSLPIWRDLPYPVLPCPANLLLFRNLSENALEVGSSSHPSGSFFESTPMLKGGLCAEDIPFDLIDDKMGDPLEETNATPTVPDS